MSAQKFCYNPRHLPSKLVVRFPAGHSATICTASLSLSAPLLVDFCFYHRPVQLYRVLLGSRTNSHGAWYTSFLYTEAVSKRCSSWEFVSRGLLTTTDNKLLPRKNALGVTIIQRLIHFAIA